MVTADDVIVLLRRVVRLVLCGHDGKPLRRHAGSVGNAVPGYVE